MGRDATPMQPRTLRSRRTFLLLAGALLMGSPHAPARDVPSSTNTLEFIEVFKAGASGYHTYRIPVLLTTINGTVLAFCEGRKNDRSDTGDIDVLLRRSSDGGRTWSEAQLIWSDGENTCGNPAPVQDPTTGVIWLLATWNHDRDHERDIHAGTSRDTRRAFIMHSADDGQTWSAPREITASVKRPHWRWYATGPVNGIQLTRGPHAGRLEAPARVGDPSGL
jgi:sialidase-1